MAFTSDSVNLFLAVLDQGSFSAAARALGRVPSAVSMAMGQLEAELDMALFDRAGREPRPTAAARALEPQARLLAAQLQQLNAQALALTQGLEERLTLAIAPELLAAHWSGPLALGDNALPDRPVVWVSWFAADAYCGSIGARLPTWNEWEYAAAADETHADARQGPAWRERILGWYSRPSNVALPRVGLQAPNAWGVQDLHGLVWEWTEDASSLLVESDNRTQGDPDKAKFCGAGALSMDDRENYAVMMRVAMLSSLDGHDATANLGFRCAWSAPR